MDSPPVADPFGTGELRQALAEAFAHPDRALDLAAEDAVEDPSGGSGRACAN